LIPTILAQAIDPHTAAIVVADLRPRRDYIFIGDLIDLLMSTAFRREGGTFNAGSGSSWGVDEVVAIVNQLLSLPKPVQSEDQIRLEEVFNVIADISCARREFGWEPRVTFRDGLRETLAWNRGAGVG
jgi:nucleoside-diphosphate-sugar epimerase